MTDYFSGEPTTFGAGSAFDFSGIPTTADIAPPPQLSAPSAPPSAFTQDVSNAQAANYGIGSQPASPSGLSSLEANANAPVPVMGANNMPLWDPASHPGVTAAANLGNGQILGSDQQVYTTQRAPQQDNLATLWSGVASGHPLDAIASNPKGDMALMTLIGAVSSYFNKRNAPPPPAQAVNPYDNFLPSQQAQLSSFQTNFAPSVRRRPILATTRNYAEGGEIKGELEPDGDSDDMTFNSGGALRLVKGGSGGQDDLVKANLSPGEYVVDADVVSALGDGNNDAGAKKLDAMREAIRTHKRSAPADSIPPKAKGALAYLKKGN